MKVINGRTFRELNQVIGDELYLIVVAMDGPGAGAAMALRPLEDGTGYAPVEGYREGEPDIAYAVARFEALLG